MFVNALKCTMTMYVEQTNIAMATSRTFIKQRQERKTVAELLRLNQSEHPANPLSFAQHETTMVDRDVGNKAPMLGHDVGSSKRCNNTVSE